MWTDMILSYHAVLQLHVYKYYDAVQTELSAKHRVAVWVREWVQLDGA